MTPIECEQLDDYLDGELDVSESGAFRRHLDDCMSCRRAVTQSNAVASLLKHAYSVERAASLPPEQSTADNSISVAATPSRRSWQLRLRTAGSKLAAGLLATAAILALWAAASYWTIPPDSLRRKVAATSSDNASDENSGPSQMVETPLRPRATVRVANDDQFVAIPMPSTQENVTIVWIYPTVQ